MSWKPARPIKPWIPPTFSPIDYIPSVCPAFHPTLCRAGSRLFPVYEQGFISSEMKSFVKDVPGSDALIAGCDMRRKASAMCLIIGVILIGCPFGFKMADIFLYTAPPAMFLIGAGFLTYRDAKRQVIELIHAYNVWIKEKD